MKRRIGSRPVSRISYGKTKFDVLTTAYLQKCACRHPEFMHDRKHKCAMPGCLCGDVKVGPSRYAKVNVRVEATRLRLSRSASIMNLGVKCHFCGDPAETRDHLLPKSKGGTLTPGNWVYACALCNGMKADRTYDEFIAYCRDIIHVEIKNIGTKKANFQRLLKAKAEEILVRHDTRKAPVEIPVLPQNGDPTKLLREPEYDLRKDGAVIYNREKKEVVFLRCMGEMGLCAHKKNLKSCGKCRKPYCDEHIVEHPKYCLGIC